MSLISKQIPSLDGGVSQQPEGMRFANQLKEQVNAISTVDKGLRKRASFKLNSIFSQTISSDSKIFTYERSLNDKIIIVMSVDGIQAYEIDGTEIQVTGPGGVAIDTSYLPALDLANSIDYTYARDTIFVLNRDKVVSMKAEAPISVDHRWYFYHIKAGVAGQTYSIQYAAAGTASHTTNSDTTVSAPKTESVANALHALLDVAPEVVDARVSGSVVAFKLDSGFDPVMIDSWGDQAHEHFSDELVSEDYIPRTWFNEPAELKDIRLKIKPDFEDTAYYIKYDGSADWIETMALGEDYQLDETTMPHSLRYITDGGGVGVDTLEFGPETWTDRTVGNLESDLTPSFIGESIKDILFFKGRLTFVSKNNVIFSEIDELFNFFRTSVRQFLDKDVVDVSASFRDSIDITHATPFNNQLILFSEKQQATLFSNGPVSASTISIELTTSYDYASDVQPIPVGANLYFLTKDNKYSRLYEYYVQENTLINTAHDASAHVPEYIPNGIKSITSSTTHNLLAMRENGSDEVTIYQYDWSGDKKTKSAFSTWKIYCDEIVHVDFIGSTMIAIVNKDNVTSVLTNDVREIVYGDLNFYPHLDFSIVPTGAYDAVNDWTTYSMQAGYPILTTDFSIVDTVSGKPVEALSQTDIQFTLSGNTTSYELMCGFNYDMIATLSRWYREDDKTGLGIRQGRLQVRTFQVDFVETSSFTIRTLQDSDTTKALAEQYPDSVTVDYQYTGFNVGAIGVSGKLLLHDGSKRQLVMCDSSRLEITLLNSTYRPSNFISASYEGMFKMRTRRV